MRALLVLVAVLLCAPARADLFTAQLAYQKTDYERAFRDYRELAELGQPVAQYNLAIMYAKGQGVRQSELNAYAWATLAAEGGESRGKSLADELRPLLAPGSEKIAEDIRAPFSRAALDARLMPKIEDDQDTEGRCRQFKRPDVAYPADADSSPNTHCAVHPMRRIPNSPPCGSNERRRTAITTACTTCRHYWRQRPSRQSAIRSAR